MGRFYKGEVHCGVQGGLVREEKLVWAKEDERKRLGGGEEEGEVYYMHHRVQGEVAAPSTPTAPAPPWRRGGPGWLH